MTPDIAKYVGQPSQPLQLANLCYRLKMLRRMSGDEMWKYYDKWDYYDMVYRGERKLDDTDRKAIKKGEPEKITLPLTFGQIQSFVGFGHALYNSRDLFYETIPSGLEDEMSAKLASAVLDRDLNYNKFKSSKLISFLTDIGRFGIGITKESWVHEQTPIVSQVIDESKLTMTRSDLAEPPAPKMKTQVSYATKFLGNKIVNVSPYRWFPDVRLPLSRWTEGEFCGDEIEMARGPLEKLEAQGLLAGLEYVPFLPDVAFENRRMTFFQRGAVWPALLQEKRYYLLTEMQIRLRPSQTFVADGVCLDPDVDDEMMYIIWILNDSRIVRISEAGYDHEEFGYNCAQLLEDQNRLVNFSLADILSACQDTATWFINARVTSVRRNVFDRALVDPRGIEMEDVIQRRPYIRRKGLSGLESKQLYDPIPTTDVTQGHIGDVQNLSAMGKEATGITDNLMGQASSGRRSAREMGNVASAGANRLIMIFSSIWESALGPQGKKMLSNIRQGLDQDTLVKVYGQYNTQKAGPGAVKQMCKVNKDQLIGNYDLDIFDGTQPSQRAIVASALQDLLMTLLKLPPEAAVVLGYDPQLILDEVLELREVRNADRFKLTAERLQQFMQLAQVTANARNPQPAPGGGGSSQPSGGPPSPQSGPGQVNGRVSAPGANGGGNSRPAATSGAAGR
jgi:hypothetical protein